MISGDSWVPQDSAPGNFDQGASLAVVGNDTIYALAANFSTDFYRYSISGNSWVTIASTPATCGNGGALVYPGAGNFLYALRGNDGVAETSFYRYSISGDTWDTLASTPASIDAGGSLAYPGTGDFIYAFRGNTTTSFYRYSISGDTWGTRDSAPAAIGTGGSLAASVVGTDTIYALRGDGQADFYRYSIAGDAWVTMPSTPLTVGAGSTILVATGNDTLFALRGNNATPFFRFGKDTTPVPLPDTTGPNIWYVNDTSTVGDGFTSAIGYDTNNGLTVSTPFRQIRTAMPLLTAGDTVYIDAGYYDSFTITQDTVWIIGKDSASTIITQNPADSQNSNLNGITASGRNNVALKDLQVRNHYVGIYFNSSSRSVIERTTVTSNYGSGIFLNNADSNIVSFNLSTNNDIGIYFQGSSNCQVLSNRSSNSISNNGFIFSAGRNNVVKWNTASNNALRGFSLQNEDGSIFEQNTSESNATLQFYIGGNPSTDTIVKNMIITSPTNPNGGVQNDVTDTRINFTRNFWRRGGVPTVDSVVIRAMISGPGRDSTIFAPFRLGDVDTAPGADTVAPKAPDTFAGAPATNATSETRAILTWKASSGSEEPEGAAGLSGYRIYRALVSGDSPLSVRGSVGAAALSFTDSGLDSNTTYFYRISAFDGAAIVNGSFFPDTVVSIFISSSVDTSGPNIWYVNDTSTVGDSFTSAIGYDTNNGLTVSTPFRTLNRLEGNLTPGDTVYVDAGFYYEADTFTIDTNGIFLIGKDSASTIIDFNNTTAAGARAIYATGRQGLTLRDFTVRRGRYGIWWNNVDTSTVTRVRADTHGLYGILLENGSDTNTLTSNTISGNSSHGILLVSSRNNTLTSNTSSGNSSAGIFLNNSSNNNTLTSNTSSGNAGVGIRLSSSSNNTLTSNTSSGNPNYGIFLASSSNNTLMSNTSSGNSITGIILSASSNNNTLTSNTSSSNSSHGIYLSSSSNNTLTSNTSSGNSSNGIFLSSSSNNTLTSNTSSGNSNYGIFLNNSSNNMLTQNTVDSNASWGFYIDFASSADTFSKNVYIGSPTLPDAGIFNGATSGWQFDFTRNWWGTTDTAAIRAKIGGAGADLITYTPFRLGIVDTAVGADTIAPKAPDTVAAAGLTATTVLVSWKASSGSEEPEGAAGLTGYKIYRSSVSGDSALVLRGQIAVGTHTFTDSGMTPVQNVYYRVTAYDAAAIVNEAYFSDSIAIATPGDTSGPNIWYVNDTSTTGDSFTSAVGNSANDGLTPATPKRRLTDLMAIGSSKLTQGDTVYIDAGIYYEAGQVRCETDVVWLIGKDSVATVIDFIDSTDISRKLYALSRTKLELSNFQVLNSGRGIHWESVSFSAIHGVSSNRSGDHGFYIGQSGVECNNNTLTSNSASFSKFSGFYIQGANNSVLQNTGSNNKHYGFFIANGTGTTTLASNCASGNGFAGYFISNTSGGTVMSNYASNNATYGFEITGASNNTFAQNTADSNASWAFYLDGASSLDTFTKNIIIGSPTRPDSGAFNNTANRFDFTRNWWGTIDSAAIRAKIGGTTTARRDSITFAPFRLGIVDTAIGADTVAPNAPDTTAGNVQTGTTVLVSWKASSGSEEPEGAANLAGYKVYRSIVSADSALVLVGQTVVGTHTLLDSGLTGVPTYYRVTAFDAATFVNESFFSDSKDVVSFNDTPFISPVLPNDTRTEDTAPWTVVLTSYGNDSNAADTPILFWTVTGGGTIIVASMLDSRTLLITPIANKNGTETVTLTLSDSKATVSQVLSITLTPDADTLAPLAVDGLTATALETGGIRISWNASPSSDVNRHRLYWDSGTGGNPDTLIYSIVVTAGQGGSFVTGVLPLGVEYRFKVIAVDASSNVSIGAYCSARAETTTYNVALADITSPRAGSRFAVGQKLQLLVSSTGTDAQKAAVVSFRFEYRPSGGAWTLMVAAANVNGNQNPNPIANSKDELGNYRFVWDASALAVDTYDLRVITLTTGTETRASGAQGIRLVNPATETPTVFSTVTTESFTLNQIINVNRGESIAITNNADSQSFMIGLPVGAFTSATDTGNVYIIMSAKDTSSFDRNLPNGRTGVWDALTVTLSNGDTQLAGGGSATVTLTFNDRNLDGFVDGTFIKWNTLRIYSHTGVAGGTWEEMTTTVSLNPTATTAGWLQARTTHFSVFRLVGLGATTNLSSFMVIPNPFRPNDADAANGQNFTGAAGTGMYFSGLPASVRIEVYTLTGQKVFNFSTTASTGQVQWDVKNDDRRDVASGVYLYVVTDLATNQRVTGKLVIIR